MTDKVLFSINRVDDEGVGIEYHAKTPDDFLCIAAGIVTILDENPVLAQLVNEIQTSLDTDEEFRKMVDNSTIRFPDFNKLLKN